MLEIIMTMGVISLLMFAFLFTCYGKEAFSEDKNERFFFWKMSVWYWAIIALMTWLLLIFCGRWFFYA